MTTNGANGVIHDVAHGTPLFVGRVGDPS